MPKPTQTYLRIKKQNSILEESRQHQQNLAVGSAEHWKKLDAVLRRTRIDEPCLRKVKQLFKELEKGEPITNDGKRLKLYIEALEQVHDVAKWYKEITGYDQKIATYSRTILNAPHNMIINPGYVTHTPSLMLAFIGLVFTIERLLIKRRR